ncbi:MAG: aminotransferase class I/II-fold pyridoxal phosphate-dependent enzyme [Pseudomonadota bacterium]|nr:aminotransferase class I/II-fold pyridoxal phosphate-dependent enzyme [Pseudomonadota bacterium]
MRPRLSRKLTGFGTTIFTEMTRLANERGAINLAQGFPDFDGPEFVKEAAVAAIGAGHGQYARMSGVPALNAALSRKYARDYALAYDGDAEITVTSGATEAIFATLQGLCDVGDEVVMFEPFYDSYRASAYMAGAIPRVATLRAPSPAQPDVGAWTFDRDAVTALFGPRTRVLLLNSPHNPTGKVYARDELEFLAGLCKEHDVVCISDEVYEHLVFDGEHIPMATLPGMRERTVTISSLGKTFSLTGWKVGWAAAPPDLTFAIRSAHQFITFATATPLQHAAVAAIESGPEFYRQLTADYRYKRDLLVGELARIGFDVTAPAGTYFACAGFASFGYTDDVAFTKHLIDVGVAVIPPSVFYVHPERGRSYVRFAFCKREATLRAAVARLEGLNRTADRGREK